jgi:hypothetical protein
MTETVALISAVTALCAVLLGPLVSLWSEKNRMRVAVLSANRQSWINELRNLIAEFMSLVGYLNATRDSDEPRSERNTKMERLLLVHSKIGLLINPKEEDHKSLMVELQKIVNASITSKDESTTATVKTGLAQLHRIAQTVLKREWERVKRAE